MIFETNYKNRPAVAISNDILAAVFLPFDGAKMASLKTADGIEMLEQAKGKEYKRLFIDTDYAAAECSGFDDMFPTIDPCVIGNFEYPDHGEACRIEHKYAVAENSISFEAQIKSVNAEIHKKIYTFGDVLNIDYVIKNRNPFDLPYIWAGHMMFSGEKGAYVTENFPEGIQKTVMFGKAPEEMNILGEYSPAGESYKYYYNDENNALECGIVYPEWKKQLMLSFDGKAVKYLGIWMNSGSFKKMYNIALEPCTAPFDSPVNALRDGKSSVIPPKGSVSFTVKLKIKNI